MKVFSKGHWVVVFMLLIGSSVSAQTSMKVTAVYPLSGNGRFDYLASSDNNKLYVSHGDAVNVLDEATGKEIGVIGGLSGVHGIAFDYRLNKGFISNGKGDNVSVFDLKTDKVMGTIATEKNPDGIIYEPYTKTIIAANGKSGSLSVIDPKTDKVIHTIALGGKPEAMASDEKGRLYVNLEDKSEIVEVDLVHNKLLRTIALAPKGEEPSGLAIDLKNHLLFAGCSNQVLLVVNYKEGTILNTYPIGEDCDAVVYNPDTKTVFSSNGDGTLTVLTAKAGASDFSVGNVVTKPGAKTMTLNRKTRTVYLSTADFEPKTGENGRRVAVANSFKVLVVK